MKKYLYIDDEDQASLEIFAKGFNQYKLIELEILDLSCYNSFEKIISEIIRRWNEIDGCLLDLRLNGSGRNRQVFSATTLAQFLRSYTVESEIDAKPIVLCSTDFDTAHYVNDFTSQDLFDYTFDKSETIDIKKISEILANLSEGYKVLNSYTDATWHSALNRFDGAFDYMPFSQILVTKKNVNQFTKFLLSQVMPFSGILINEDVLAARLGIDKEKSKAWNDVVKIFNSAEYKGVFSGLERYFWSDLFEERFRTLTKKNGLASLRAIDRVRCLQECVGFLEIVPAQPLEYAESSMFWTICEATRKPLDALEGYILKEKEPLAPWQEPHYVSFYALNQEKIDKRELLDEEREHYECDLDDMDS